MYRTLIDAAALQGLIQSGASLALFDCRNDLLDPAFGATQYAAGHIPCAVHAHLDHDLSGPKTGQNGRHPLPDRAAFAAWLAAKGVGPGTQVIAYDAQGGMYAARLWWMCRWVGIETVALLDGGLPAWQQAGGALTADTAAPTPATLPLREPLVSLVTADDVLNNLQTPLFTVLDARAPERFRGEVEPIDPVAGHIPGAMNRFFKDNLTADGRFKPAEQLQEEFAGLLAHAEPEGLVMSCGSGATACHNILALEIAGGPTAPMYAGSWSEWCSDPARPVAKGA
jgi:thiosulfate/3-mercaptopyruvate sulfurtransferase